MTKLCASADLSKLPRMYPGNAGRHLMALGQLIEQYASDFESIELYTGADYTWFIQAETDNERAHSEFELWNAEAEAEAIIAAQRVDRIKKEMEDAE